VSDRVACVSPGPPASLLRRCRALGVGRVTVDNAWELRKAAALLPGAAVSVALRLPPAGRLRYPAAPLGCPLEELDGLLTVARSLPVELSGVAVHVGSQCERLAAWREAVAVAAAAWRRLLAAGFQPRTLSLGGGLPVAYRRRVPGPRAILRAIRPALASEFPSRPAEIWLEPGRYLAADAGTLAATVLAVDERPGRRPRVRLDVGRYHGLPEAALGIGYRFAAASVLSPRRCVVTGPLGEAQDLLDLDAWLPPPAPGDRVYVSQAGAYTLAQYAYPTAVAAAIVVQDAGRHQPGGCGRAGGADGRAEPGSPGPTRVPAAASRTLAESSTREGSAAGPRS
jgi:ornithine decarboxylase